MVHVRHKGDGWKLRVITGTAHHQVSVGVTLD